VSRSSQNSRSNQNPRSNQNSRPGQNQRSGQGSRRSTRPAEPEPNAELPTTAPPKLPDGGLRIVALGGIGEIGRNMTVFEFAGRLLIVDCGVLFPAEDSPGVDLILPDFRAIENRLDDIDALILTHGHEDHIGAIPFLLRQRPDIPIVGSRFTLALVAAKCKEHRLTPHMREVREGQRSTHGSFECEYFAVNHSIPDAMAVAIRTPAGLVLHTGDFKLDQLPLDGRLTDLAGFSRLGDEGVDLLLVDSTNADVPGFVIAEREIGPVLEKVFDDSPQRIIVACFASHVHRVQQVFDAAAARGRKVCLVGRSMLRNMSLAAEMGLLNVPEGSLVELDEAMRLPDSELVLVSTGSQGEPLSALSRMARGEHRQVRIVPDDTVILASSLIPGNETAVFGVINGLTRLSARVVHQGNAKVHVSGHAPAGELLFLYNAVRPSNVMPVHGEWRHLRANAALAIKTGVAEDSVVLAEDGVVVDLVDGHASVTGRVEVGRVYVDGLSVGDIGETTLGDRLVLGEGGFIAITIAMSAATGKVVATPTVSGRGVSDDPKALHGVVPRIENELYPRVVEGVTDHHRIAQAVRRVAGRWVADTYRRRPMIVPTVIPV
jgi:ribonuclease J